VNSEIFDLAEIQNRLSPVFQANNVKSAILFGSYAKGEATPQSDVDILVDSGLRGLEFMGLVEYVYEALEKNVDLIDVHYVEKGSKIEREIQQ
jgi:predicted nucleotidyltransferase